ncbi:MAG: hypothetical protein RJA70_444 [Pseudomonadota bacterium]
MTTPSGVIRPSPRSSRSGIPSAVVRAGGLRRAPWRNGIRSGFKIRGLRSSRFESGRGYSRNGSAVSNQWILNLKFVFSCTRSVCR